MPKQVRTHLLVCAGTGCVSSGAFALKDALEKEVVRRGLADEVLVVATGCNGFCERGRSSSSTPTTFSISA